MSKIITRTKCETMFNPKACKLQDAQLQQNSIDYVQTGVILHLETLREVN